MYCFYCFSFISRNKKLFEGLTSEKQEVTIKYVGDGVSLDLLDDKQKIIAIDFMAENQVNNNEEQLDENHLIAIRKEKLKDLQDEFFKKQKDVEEEKSVSILDKEAFAELVQNKLKEVVEPNNNRVAKELSTVYLLKNTKNPKSIFPYAALSWSSSSVKSRTSLKSPFSKAICKFTFALCIA